MTDGPSTSSPVGGAVLPPELRGTWERVAFTIDDQPVETPARALWLQGGRGFADLRVPAAAGPVMCFAGTTSWDGRDLTWHHALDIGEWVGADTGRVSWSHGDLVETGTMVIDGELRPYEEAWRRVDPDRTSVSVSVLRGEAADGSLVGILVAAAHHAITLVDHRDGTAGAFAATSWRRTGDDWVVGDRVGATVALPAPPPVIPAVGSTVHLAEMGGCARWTVTEHGQGTP